MAFQLIDINALLGIETLDACTKLTLKIPPTPIIIPKIGGISMPNVSIGSGPFDLGIHIRWKCPGFPACGREEGACKWEKKKGWQLNPLTFMPIKLWMPPNIPVLFPGYRLQIPIPFTFDPRKCPNNPKKVATT